MSPSNALPPSITAERHGEVAVRRARGLRWALLHAPLVFALYWRPMRQALDTVPAGFSWAMIPSYVVGALALSLIPLLATLPLSRWRGAFRFALPLATGLGATVLALDAVLVSTVGFHINSFFFRVLAQPNALAETGIATGEVAFYGALALLFVAADVTLGAWLLGRPHRRAPGGGRVWVAIAVLLALALVERVYVSTLNFYGGPALFAASGVLPLQVPLRMNGLLTQLTGRRSAMRQGTLISTDTDISALPPGLDPAEVKLTKRPDILFVLSESMRADYLEPSVMPLLSERAKGGAVFERHYSTGCATYYGVFGALFGIQGTHADLALGAGRAPLLFSALKANGYRVRILTASGIDWMGLKQSVFKDVSGELSLFLKGPGDERDEAMIATARTMIGEADADQPLFTFLFFMGTHFNYSFPARSAKAVPFWDGEGGIHTPGLDRESVKRRAQNAATEIDQKLDEFLTWYESARGRRPLVLFTGDHGEEFGEKGHIAHGSDVTNEQIHVPLVLLGDDLPRRGRFENVTSHVDLIPTLLALLGDTHAPSLYSDGLSLFDSPEDRFVLATVGWEPRYAAIGRSLKVYFSSFGTRLMGPDDRPVVDAEAKFAGATRQLMGLFRRGDRARRPVDQESAEASEP